MDQFTELLFADDETFKTAMYRYYKLLADEEYVGNGCSLKWERLTMARDSYR